MNVSSKTRNLALAGIFAALITLFIWFVKIPIPATSGYVHLGDSLIYMAVYLLPAPYAIAAAAIGGAAADLCVGAVSYVLPTAVIKALMAFFASIFFRGEKTKPLQFVLAFALGAAVTVGGYFVFEWAYWGLGYAVTGLLWNLVQALSAAVLTVPFVKAARSIIKRRV
jgi:uncharacterized membrane protein